jgi:hypothetical protein
MFKCLAFSETYFVLCLVLLSMILFFYDTRNWEAFFVTYIQLGGWFIFVALARLLCVTYRYNQVIKERQSRRNIGTPNF